MPVLLTQIGYYVAIFGGLIAAIFLGSSLGSEDYSTVVLSFAGLVGLTWIVASGDRWWMPMPFAVGLGGVFYAPFKIFPHEIALAACGAALLPRIPFKVTGLRKRRPPLPFVFYLLFAYLLVHASVSIFLYRDAGGLGNVVRAYMNSMWGLIFGLGFYLYGSTRSLHIGFRLFYIALLARVAMGLYNVAQGAPLLVPGVNFALDAQDIRTSTNLLMVVAGFASVVGSGVITRVINAGVALTAAVLWLTLGGSRGQLVFVLAFVAVVAVVFRWRVMVILMAAGALLLATALNLAPNIISGLPYQTQRALTAFMVDAPLELEVQSDVQGSSRFREVISQEGYTRWTSSPRTFAFGTGIQPFDEGFAAQAGQFEIDSFTLFVQSSADVGAYETALWTILAVTGLVGFTLFFAVFVAVAGRLLKGLRTLPLEGYGRAFATWAVAALTTTFFLCFLGGTFPSYEFFLAFIGLAYVEDVRATRPSSVKSLPSASEAKIKPPIPHELAPAGA